MNAIFSLSRFNNPSLSLIELTIKSEILISAKSDLLTFFTILKTNGKVSFYFRTFGTFFEILSLSLYEIGNISLYITKYVKFVIISLVCSLYVVWIGLFLIQNLQGSLAVNTSLNWQEEAWNWSLGYIGHLANMRLSSCPISRQWIEFGLNIWIWREKFPGLFYCLWNFWS